MDTVALMGMYLGGVATGMLVTAIVWLTTLEIGRPRHG